MITLLLTILTEENKCLRIKNYIDKYNNHYDGINYPMTLDQIPKFEQQNNKTINVYEYELTTDTETKKEKLDMP